MDHFPDYYAEAALEQAHELLDHPTANPRRVEFFADLSSLLRDGQILTQSDLAELAPVYDYSPNSARGMLDGEKARLAMEILGVELRLGFYRGTVLFKNAIIEPDQTNIDEVKSRIDEELRLAAIRKRAGRWPGISQRKEPPELTDQVDN